VAFKVRREREVYRGRVFRLVTKDVILPNGREATYGIVEHPGAVAIVPRFDNGDVIMLKQFRVAVGGEIYEIPAGTLNPGEPPAATARRELIEETGHRCGRLRKIAEFYTAPGFCTELMRLYVAENLTPAHADGDDDEVIRPERMSWGRAMDLVRRGRVRDAKSIVGLMMADGR
jgi:ADP-ribose diphosphatase